MKPNARLFAYSVFSSLGLSILSFSANAEVVTIDCIYLPDVADPITGTEFTADIDYSARFIRFGTGKRVRIDNLTDRYVYFGNGDNYFDRKTGGYLGRRAGNSWGLIANCHRVESGHKF